MPPKVSSLMLFRQNRVETFENGAQSKNSKQMRYWTYEVPSIAQIADCGFYFTPTKLNPDQITCISCKKKETNISGIENVAEFHLDHNPSCGLSRIIASQIQYISSDNDNKYWTSRDQVALREPLSKEAVSLRKKSFGSFWKFDKQEQRCRANSTNIARAGFYFSPLREDNDRVQCVYCGCSLDTWEPDDDPIEEHYNNSIGTCYFLERYEESKKEGPKKPARLSKKHLEKVVSNNENSNYSSIDDGMESTTFPEDLVNSDIESKALFNNKVSQTGSNAVKDISSVSPTIEVEKIDSHMLGRNSSRTATGISDSSGNLNDSDTSAQYNDSITSRARSIRDDQHEEEPVSSKTTHTENNSPENEHANSSFDNTKIKRNSRTRQVSKNYKEDSIEMTYEDESDDELYEEEEEVEDMELGDDDYDKALGLCKSSSQERQPKGSSSFRQKKETQINRAVETNNHSDIGSSFDSLRFQKVLESPSKGKRVRVGDTYVPSHISFDTSNHHIGYEDENIEYLENNLNPAKARKFKEQAKRGPENNLFDRTGNEHRVSDVKSTLNIKLKKQTKRRNKKSLKSSKNILDMSSDESVGNLFSDNHAQPLEGNIAEPKGFGDMNPPSEINEKSIWESNTDFSRNILSNEEDNGIAGAKKVIDQDMKQSKRKRRLSEYPEDEYRQHIERGEQADKRNFKRESSKYPLLKPYIEASANSELDHQSVDHSSGKVKMSSPVPPDKKLKSKFQAKLSAPRDPTNDFITSDHNTAKMDLSLEGSIRRNSQVTAVHNPNYDTKIHDYQPYLDREVSQMADGPELLHESRIQDAGSFPQSFHEYSENGTLKGVQAHEHKSAGKGYSNINGKNIIHSNSLQEMPESPAYGFAKVPDQISKAKRVSYEHSISKRKKAYNNTTAKVEAHKEVKEAHKEVEEAHEEVEEAHEEVGEAHEEVEEAHEEVEEAHEEVGEAHEEVEEAHEEVEEAHEEVEEAHEESDEPCSEIGNATNLSPILVDTAALASESGGNLYLMKSIPYDKSKASNVKRSIESEKPKLGFSLKTKRSLSVSEQEIKKTYNNPDHPTVDATVIFDEILESSTPQNSKSNYGVSEFSKNNSEITNGWTTSKLTNISNLIQNMENASGYLKKKMDTKCGLNNDFDGDLTSFISNMPEEEENMSIKQWVIHNASNCESLISQSCTEMIKAYEVEFSRAIDYIENLPTVD